MYNVWLQGTEELYGSFITKTEAQLFFERRGWVKKDNIPVPSWEVTVNGRYLFVILRTQTDQDIIFDREQLPQGETLPQQEDLVGSFYRTHFQTV